MKKKEFRKALKNHIDFILGKDSVHKKALYRKAKCYFFLDEFENCRKFLNIFKKTYGEDKDGLDLEKSLENKIRIYENKNVLKK